MRTRSGVLSVWSTQNASLSTVATRPAAIVVTKSVPALSVGRTSPRRFVCLSDWFACMVCTICVHGSAVLLLGLLCRQSTAGKLEMFLHRWELLQVCETVFCLRFCMVVCCGLCVWDEANGACKLPLHSPTFAQMLHV